MKKLEPVMPAAPPALVPPAPTPMPGAEGLDFKELLDARKSVPMLSSHPEPSPRPRPGKSTAPRSVDTPGSTRVPARRASDTRDPSYEEHRAGPQRTPDDKGNRRTELGSHARPKHPGVDPPQEDADPTVERNHAQLSSAASMNTAPVAWIADPLALLGERSPADMAGAGSLPMVHGEAVAPDPHQPAEGKRPAAAGQPSTPEAPTLESLSDAKADPPSPLAAESTPGAPVDTVDSHKLPGRPLWEPATPGDGTAGAPPRPPVARRDAAPADGHPAESVAPTPARAETALGLEESGGSPDRLRLPIDGVNRVPSDFALTSFESPHSRMGDHRAESVRAGDAPRSLAGSPRPDGSPLDAALSDLLEIHPVAELTGTADPSARSPEHGLDRLIPGETQPPHEAGADGSRTDLPNPATRATAMPGDAASPSAISESAPPRALDLDLIQELVQKTRTLLQHGARSEVRIALHPEALGELHLRAILEGGRLTASIATESAAVKDFLERHLPLLQSTLAEQGFDAARIEVQHLDSFSSALSGDGRSATQHEPPSPLPPQPAYSLASGPGEPANPAELAASVPLVGGSGLINLLV